jgi:hypothetical protein
MKAVEIPLAGVSPRFAAVYGSRLDGCARDATTRRRAWFAIRPALYQRLQSLLDDGWEIVPRTLGPHSLRIALQRESHLAATSFTGTQDMGPNPLDRRFDLKGDR